MLPGILRQMSKSDSKALVPLEAELSIQQVADLLGVSRPYVVKLWQTAISPFTSSGGSAASAVKICWTTFKSTSGARRSR